MLPSTGARSTAAATHEAARARAASTSNLRSAATTAAGSAGSVGARPAARGAPVNSTSAAACSACADRIGRNCPARDGCAFSAASYAASSRRSAARSASCGSGGGGDVDGSGDGEGSSESPVQPASVRPATQRAERRLSVLIVGKSYRRRPRRQLSATDTATLKCSTTSPTSEEWRWRPEPDNAITSPA